MALIRRHGWRATLWLALLGAVALAAWASHPAGAQPETEPEALSPELYGRVQRLRSALSLGSQDLAALGLDQAQAEAALASLKSWAESNASRLDQADAQVRQRQHELGEIQRKINIGPRDEGATRQASRLLETLPQAETQRAQLHLEAAAGLGLTAAQRQAWDASRASARLGVTGFQRYIPNLRASEARAIREALYAQAHGVAPDGNASALLRHPAADQARSNARAKLPGVLVAEEAVLPLPEALKPALRASTASAAGSSEVNR